MKRGENSRDLLADVEVTVYAEEGGTYCVKKCSCSKCLNSIETSNFSYEMSDKILNFEKEFNKQDCFAQYLKNFLEAIKSNNAGNVIKFLDTSMRYIHTTMLDNQGAFIFELLKTSVDEDGDDRFATLFSILLSYDIKLKRRQSALVTKRIFDYWVVKTNEARINIQQVIAMMYPYDLIDHETAVIVYALELLINDFKFDLGAFESWLFDVGVFTQQSIHSDILPAMNALARKGVANKRLWRFDSQLNTKNVTSQLARKKLSLKTRLKKQKKQQSNISSRSVTAMPAVREKSIDEWVRDIEGACDMNHALIDNKHKTLSSSSSSLEEREPISYDSSSDSSESDSDDGLERLLNFCVDKRHTYQSPVREKAKRETAIKLRKESSVSRKSSISPRRSVASKGGGGYCEVKADKRHHASSYSLSQLRDGKNNSHYTTRPTVKVTKPKRTPVQLVRTMSVGSFSIFGAGKPTSDNKTVFRVTDSYGFMSAAFEHGLDLPGYNSPK